MQVVPTSITPDELCVNGMSFSRRQSKWANAALVVGTDSSDWGHHTAQHGVLAGAQLQIDAERCANPAPRRLGTCCLPRAPRYCCLPATACL